MLNAFRSGKQSIFMKAFLFGMLALSLLGLAVMDVQGMFRQGAAPNSVVATIGNSRITVAELEQMVAQHLQNRNIPRQIAFQAGLPSQILDSEIATRVMARAAHDAGLRPSDVEAARTVKNVLHNLTAEGLTEREALDRLMQNMGVSERTLLQMSKTQLATERLVDFVGAGALPPPVLVKAAQLFDAEQRSGAFITLDASAASDIPTPSEDDLRTHYNDIIERFALPEYRSFAVLHVTKSALGLKDDIAEDEVKAYYDAHKDSYARPETRIVSQAVADDLDTAQKIRASLLAGKDLAAAAKDSGAKPTLIKGQSYVQGDLPSELDVPAFAASAGDVTEPVRSALGWHVLAIEKILPPQAPDFADMRDTVRADLLAERHDEALYQTLNDIEDAAASGKSLAEVAEQFSLPLVTMNTVDARGLDKNGKAANTGLPALEQVLTEAFALQTGTAGQVLDLRDGSYALVEVAEIIPTQDQPFEDVRAAVEKSYRQQESAKAAQALAESLTQELADGTATFDALAQKYGKKAVKTGLVSRKTQPKDLKADMADGVIAALFRLPATTGAATAYKTADDRIVAVRLDSREIADATASKEDSVSLENALARGMQNDIMGQYHGWLMQEYDVEVNHDVLARMYAAAMQPAAE